MPTRRGFWGLLPAAGSCPGAAPRVRLSSEVSLPPARTQKLLFGVGDAGAGVLPAARSPAPCPPLPSSTQDPRPQRHPFRCPGMRLLRQRCNPPATTAPTPAASAGAAAAVARGTCVSPPSPPCHPPSPRGPKRAGGVLAARTGGARGSLLVLRGLRSTKGLDAGPCPRRCAGYGGQDPGGTGSRSSPHPGVLSSLLVAALWAAGAGARPGWSQPLSPPGCLCARVRPAAESRAGAATRKGVHGVWRRCLYPEGTGKSGGLLRGPHVARLCAEPGELALRSQASAHHGSFPSAKAFKISRAESSIGNPRPALR